MLRDRPELTRARILRSRIRNWNIKIADKSGARAAIHDVAEYIDWAYVSSNMELSEDFIREFAEFVDWGTNSINGWTRKIGFGISAKQLLSEPFIAEFKDKVEWKSISKFQSLSNAFIDAYADRVYWRYISMYQTVSIPLIVKHKKKIVICKNIERCIRREQATRELNRIIPTDMALYIGEFM